MRVSFNYGHSASLMFDPADDASILGSRPLEAQVGGLILERGPVAFAVLQFLRSSV